jgi:hypothetical protein
MQSTSLEGVRMDSSTAGAEFSDDRRFRFSLWRIWGDGPDYAAALKVAGRHRLVHFCMLNPSIANERELDPTLRRCLGFAKSWGMDGMLITNLYPLVATDPKQLLATLDIRGPQKAAWYINDTHISDAAQRAEFTVVGWGASVAKMPLSDRVERFYCSLLGVHGAVKCLGVTKGGHPVHPLYIAANTPLQDWTPA